MTESPVVFRSLTVHYVFLCVILMAWGFLGLDSAEYSLLVLYTDPARWAMTCLYGMGGISVSVFIVALAMKLRTVYSEASWEVRSRELSFEEYRQITSEYRHEYRHLLQQWDWPLVIVVLSIAGATATFPFVTMTALPPMVLLSPYFFALLLIVLGLTSTQLFYQITPNSATRHFRYLSPRKLRRVRGLLDEIPALSWKGVVVDICEAGGFYSIRDPVVAGRIRGMEAAALVTVETDHQCRPVLAKSKLKAHGDRPEVNLGRNLHPPEYLAEFKALVVDTILKYLEGVEDASLVSDSLIELGALAEEQEEGDSGGPSADELVFGDDRSARRESRDSDGVSGSL